MLTENKLKELLNYDPETGVFTNRTDRGTTKAGNQVGYVGPSGYHQIHIGGKLRRSHRLAWLYTYGYLPEHLIDHRDRCRTNNRIDNLRHVSYQCNARNTGNPKNNTSGVKGVCYIKSSGRWSVYIGFNNASYQLGIYRDFKEAVCVRLAAEQCLDWSGCDEASPAYKYVKENIQ